jgi:RHS repeat-associated protein
VYTTQYRYDSFGRLLELVLPDSEVVTYAYDAGGSLQSFGGDKQGTQVSYLNLVHYDKFEQRTRLVLGNGIETKYAYDPASRRLDTLTSAGARAGTFQNLHYGYDKVGNILNLQNQVDVPPPTTFGGPNKQQFGYDDLYRLTTAKGEYKSAPDRTRNYTLDLTYDSNHNILAKKQSDVVTVAGGSAIPQKGTSYDWQYDYAGRQPHAPTHIGNRTFRYDLNGNQTGWDSDVNGTRRHILWDEENRISEIDDNGQRNRYVYDANGERTVKLTKQGETVYVNQYYVVRNRSVVSKHLYAGTGRVVSHLVMGTAPGNEQRGAPGNGHGSDKTPTTPETGNGNGNSGNVVKGNNGQAGNDKEHSNNGLHLGQLKNEKENPGQGRDRRSDTADAHAQDVVKNPTLTGEQPGQGNDNRSDNAISLAQSPTSQLVVTEGEASVELGGDTSGGESVESVTETFATPTVNGQSEFIWYYHPDHLGSTGFVTDQNGELYEHVEYFPFGETWVQEKSNTQRTPYLYTGKELDEETGLYYYGARYYDPRTSVWQSADPILAKYLSGDINGGVYNSSNLSAYAYSYLSPIVLLDPDGNAPSAKEAAQMASHVYGDTSLTGGWQVASASSARSLGLQIRDNSTGFNSQLYVRGDNEYFYATQGTNPTSGDDWRNNKQQLSGTSAQYRQSVQNAKALSRILGAEADLSFGGHSLGGGLAAANAMGTGRDAKTFNAAAVSDATKRALGLGKPGQIDAFVVRGEALDAAQRLIGMTADGTRHSLEPATPYAPNIPLTRVDDFIRAGQSGYNHTMGAVLDALP